MEGGIPVVGALTPHSFSDEGQLTKMGRKQSPEKECTHYREKGRGDCRQITKEGEIGTQMGKDHTDGPTPMVLYFTTFRTFSAAKDTHLAQGSCHGQNVVYP